MAAVHLCKALVEKSIKWPDILPTYEESEPKIPSTAGICNLDAYLFGNLMHSGKSFPFDVSKIAPKTSRWLSLRMAELIHEGLECPIHARNLSLYTTKSSTYSYLPLFSELMGLHFTYSSHDDEFPTIILPYELTLGRILLLSNKWGFSTNTIKILVNHLKSMGISVPNLETWVSNANVKLSNQQITLLTTHLNDREPAIDRLTPVHLLRAAIKWGLKIEGVDIARPLSVYGLAVPDHNSFQTFLTCLTINVLY